VPPLSGQSATYARDSAAVAAVAAGFHAALSSGDSTAALAFLADDVLILESGGVETRAQYRAGHLSGDIAYAKAVPSTRTIQNLSVRGDVAWVTTMSVTSGQYNGRAVNSQGAELMVLSRSGGTWKVSAIHWSSRARRATGG
jgi:ketosteroid isomerase-like protein